MSSSLRKDSEELLRLSNLSQSQNVKRILVAESQKLTRLAEEEEKIQASSKKTATPVTSPKTVYPISKLFNYGWDQSDKFVKIYVTLNGVHTFSPNNVSSNFTKKSFELHIINETTKLNNVLVITNLLHNIKPEDSYHKIKTDMVVVFLKKEGSSNWAYVTETEKKTKDTKVPKLDKDEDPSAGLMTLMKQMYQDGDDDMKRTIAKAWTESRDKPSEFS